MGMTAQEMKEWAKKNNKFVKLSDGESITATFKEVKTITKDSFGTEKEVMRYTLILEDGSLKIFENGSIALANEMANFLGSKVTVTRHGEKQDTRYEIEPA